MSVAPVNQGFVVDWHCPFRLSGGRVEAERPPDVLVTPPGNLPGMLDRQCLHDESVEPRWQFALDHAKLAQDIGPGRTGEAFLAARHPEVAIVVVTDHVGAPLDNVAGLAVKEAVAKRR